MGSKPSYVSVSDEEEEEDDPTPLNESSSVHYGGRRIYRWMTPVMTVSLLLPVMIQIDMMIKINQLKTDRECLFSYLLDVRYVVQDVYTSANVRRRHRPRPRRPWPKKKEEPYKKVFESRTKKCSRAV